VGKAVSKTEVSNTGVSGVSQTKSVVSQTGVSQTKAVVSSVSNSGSSNDGTDGRVVDQMRSREGLRHGSVSSNDGGVSFTLGDGGVGSGVLSTGSEDLGGLSNGLGSNSGEDGSHEGLWVEGGGNSVIDGSNGELSVEFGSNGETRILNTESKTISDVSDGLKNSIGVDIRVSSVDSSISVSDLLLHGVDVGVTIVEVSELILGVELASGSIVGSVSVGNGGSHGGGVSSGVNSGAVVKGAQVHGLIGGKAYGHKGGKGDEESHDVLPSV